MVDDDILISFLHRISNLIMVIYSNRSFNPGPDHTDDEAPTEDQM